MLRLSAISKIDKRYETGDTPFLILCSDSKSYVCKYKRPGLPANKLVCELIGARIAKSWRIITPEIAFVEMNGFWDGYPYSHDTVAPVLGSQFLKGVADLSQYNFDSVPKTRKTVNQLLRIALFDMWVANEDRTANNYNMLFNIDSQDVISIDYGGVFNSNVISRPLFNLNKDDSILSSELAGRLFSNQFSMGVLEHLKEYYMASINRSKAECGKIIADVPPQWEITVEDFENKLAELFDERWIDSVWDNFMQIIKEI